MKNSGCEPKLLTCIGKIPIYLEVNVPKNFGSVKFQKKNDPLHKILYPFGAEKMNEIENFNRLK